jgi:thioredoxin
MNTKHQLKNVNLKQNFILMKTLFFALSLLLFACGGTNLTDGNTANAQPTQTNLTAKEFSMKLEQTPSAQIIDVRTPGEVAGGFINNAVNIDYNSSDFTTKTSQLDKNKPTFVYCLSGGRSGAAAAQMRSEGFKIVYELTGGIMKWNAAGLPLVTKNQAPKKQGMTLNDFNKLTTSDKLVLVDFYAEWCAPCKRMKPYLEEIAKDMNATVTVVRIDVDQHPSLMKELKIEELPVLRTYKKGTMTWEQKGFIEKAEVVKKLN